MGYDAAKKIKGYQGATTAAAVRKAARIPLEIVKRSDTAKGFVVLPKRWIVERTFRVARPLPPPRQGLREPDTLASGLRPARHDPPHDATYRKAQKCLIK